MFVHSKMHLFILVHRFVFEGCHTFDEHRTVKKVQALRMLHNNNYLRYVYVEGRRNVSMNAY